MRVLQALVPLLAIALTLAAAELALRLLAPTPRASEYNLPFDPDPVTGYRMRPNASGEFVRGGVAHTNSHGHRDDETPRTKPAGRRRILLLGDSFSVGVNVAREHTWPQLLEQALRERCGPEVEIVNAAVAGWDPFQYARYYAAEGEAFEPDLVLVGFFVGNDAYSMALDERSQLSAVAGRRVRPPASERARRWLAVKVGLYRHSHLARRWFNRELRVLSAEEFADAPEPRDGGRFTRGYLGLQASRMQNHRRHHPLQREIAARNVAQIARIQERARAAGAPLLVVLIPDENQVNAGLREAVFADPALLPLVFPGSADLPGNPAAPFDFSMPQRLLTPLFEAQGIPWLDLLSALRSDERRLYMNDSHWNEAGHARVAAILGEALERQPAVCPAGGTALLGCREC